MIGCLWEMQERNKGSSAPTIQGSTVWGVSDCPCLGPARRDLLYVTPAVLWGMCNSNPVKKGTFISKEFFVRRKGGLTKFCVHSRFRPLRVLYTLCVYTLDLTGSAHTRMWGPGWRPSLSLGASGWCGDLRKTWPQSWEVPCLCLNVSA